MEKFKSFRKILEEEDTNFDSLLAAIRKLESGSYEGKYDAKSKKSSASGAYQFIDKTWRSMTNQSGVGKEYKRAADAPREIQDQVMSHSLKGNVDKYGVKGAINTHYTGNPEGRMSRKGLKANGGFKSNHYYDTIQKNIAGYKMPSDAASGPPEPKDNNPELEKNKNMVATTTKQDAPAPTPAPVDNKQTMPKIDHGPPPAPASTPQQAEKEKETKVQADTQKNKVDSWESSGKSFINRELNKEETMIQNTLNELTGKGKIRDIVNRTRNNVEKKSSVVTGHRQARIYYPDPSIKAKMEKDYGVAKLDKNRADTLHGMVMRKEKNSKADISDGFGRLKNLRKMKNTIREEDMSQEELNELSKGTLGRYIKKAHYDGGKQDFRHGMSVGKRRGKPTSAEMELSNKSLKREKGIGLAVDKLTREDTQLDELSKGTLASYIKKAKDDYGMQAADYASSLVRNDYKKGSGNTALKTSRKRSKGINMAVNRLTKEESQLELALGDLLEKNYIGMQERISEVLGEKVIMALDERKQIIASSYFGQSE